jgi:hypothetical protein
MSAYYKCENTGDVNREDEETEEPAILPYYAYIVLTFLAIMFFVVIVMFLIKYRRIDILSFVNNNSANLKMIYFGILYVSVVAMIILSIIKVTDNDGNYFSSIMFLAFFVLSLFLIIFSIVKIIF